MTKRREQVEFTQEDVIDAIISRFAGDDLPPGVAPADIVLCSPCPPDVVARAEWVRGHDYREGADAGRRLVQQKLKALLALAKRCGVKLVVHEKVDDVTHSIDVTEENALVAFAGE